MSRPSAEQATEPLAARYFDGRSSRAHAVRVDLVTGAPGLQLRVRPSGTDMGVPDLCVPAAEVIVGELMGGAPRDLVLPHGLGHLEVPAGPALEMLLEGMGQRDPLHVRAAFNPKGVLLALASFLVAALLGYRFVLPWAADAVAVHLPEAAAQAISRRTLDLLLQQATRPTQLSDACQQTFKHALATWRWPGRPQMLTLHFRHAPEIGPNALALPSGDILVTDELVELAGSRDELVMAVIAHEVGHVQGRHGLRILVHGAVLSAILGWWFGDVSALAVAAPGVLARGAYSRDMETQADDYAAQALRAQGRSPALLADMLQRLDDLHPEDNAASAPSGAPWGVVMGRYLSSHPVTALRVARLREAAS